MSLFSKDESYLGVDIGAGGLKLVELKKTKGRPQLWTYGIVNESLDIHLAHEKTSEELTRETAGMPAPEPGGETMPTPGEPIDVSDPRIERYAKLLRELMRAARATSTQVTASLPVSYIFHAVVTLPKIDDKEIERHVTAKVKKVLPRPIEEMQVVHQIIPSALPKERQKDIKVLVTAAPKDLVAFYTAIFQRAGLKLQELETEAFALERSLVGRDTATVMVVDIGAERTNFFIIDQGLPITHRSIQIGGNTMDDIIEKQLGVRRDLVSQVKMDLSTGGTDGVTAELFSTVLDPIIKEIQYGFELFLSQSGNQTKTPEKIILTGGASLFPLLVPQLSQATGMKVFVGDPWARTVYQDGLKSVLDGIGPRMAVSIGLALRNIV